MKQLTHSNTHPISTHTPNNSLLMLFDGLDVRETTRREYKHYAKMFVRFAKQNGLNCDTFLQYKRALGARTDMAVATKNKYLACARILLKELHRRGELPTDITHNVKSFKQGRKHKKSGLDEAEVEMLAARLRNKKTTPHTARLRAMLALLLFQGLRQCEVVRLNVSDIDVANSTALVRGKGEDDTEPIDLHPKTVSALSSYMKVCKVADGPLFPSRSNNSRGKRISTVSLRNIVNSELAELGIQKSAHAFRHHFVTRLIQAYRGDLIEVSKFSRHESLSMLQVYNDNVSRKRGLPKYYRTFAGIKLGGNET